MALLTSNIDPTKSFENNVFEGTRSVRDLTKYLLMRGVTDFGDLEQYNLYESGYSFLNVLDIPVFIDRLRHINQDTYDVLIRSYAHVLEFEFRGFEGGLDNMTADSGQLTNGINQINIINKVNKPSDSTFSATYQEKLGGLISKFHELYLSGIKDPRTEVKTYHGLVGSSNYTIRSKNIFGSDSYSTKNEGHFGSYERTLSDANSSGLQLEAGFENEIFKLMYIVTDNTLLGLEKAVYLAAAQLTSAPFDIYTGSKGTYEFKEISVEFNAYPVMCKQVNWYANIILQHIYDDTVWREFDFNYRSLYKTAQDKVEKDQLFYHYNSDIGTNMLEGVDGYQGRSTAFNGTNADLNP